jgi:serine/threonine-protein kinase
MSDRLLERWRQVEPIFERALELPTAECSTFVERECGADRELLEEVRDLLAAEGQAGDLLETPAGRYAGGLLEDLSDGADPTTEGTGSQPRSQIGRYRILEKIGAGGMSRVYLAEREDGAFRQRVALEIMRLFGAHREEREWRFRVERQLLASLTPRSPTR